EPPAAPLLRPRQPPGADQPPRRSLPGAARRLDRGSHLQPEPDRSGRPQRQHRPDHATPDRPVRGRDEEPHMTEREGSIPCRRGEAGSAYMIVIGALAVLSTIGLALIAVTQTEFQIGGSERVNNRVFYAADSGIAVATARALVSGDYTATTF